ncbi:TPA: hypothetical protein DD449_01930 [Candidatus Berkelbacteria bacterium]|uniref:DUF5680 domain-containing protein n=1 Tax=Berkelbacteria bacterium GW2011_GWE1_39_12 TaxID=1618337 RepID=A0A0G4B653_9BACT|nr:MAG: hypothetical protein UT28_C0001G0700 [Berkelbacteria bacterium GW2011_GWE1_39_12]HBO60417.1 hypothetical protein [Candidatus Berkelbacteria bacterium]
MESKTLDFLIKSRQSTYASGIKPKIIDGANVYTIKDGDLEYRDVYYDQHLFFQGQEVLIKNGAPIWSMSYRGAAIEDFDPGEVFTVLQKLIKENADKVRFGDFFEKSEGGYNYVSKGEGNSDEFKGREEMYQNKKLAHWMEYFAGTIK